ncbi:hypothetical protein [Vibrio variabilis]|uniref:hypothetical protein n=1 Tax=Vibrio variabilis TaxID=990271 RepID=UPI000DDB9D55|nr:hypothetical protein [Vibrio variabilis]
MKARYLTALLAMSALLGCENSDDSTTQNQSPPQAATFTAPYSVILEGLGEGSLVGTEVPFSLTAQPGVLSTLEITGAEAVETNVASQNTTNNTQHYKTSQGGFVVTRGDNAPTTAIVLELVVTIDGYFTNSQQIEIPAESDVAQESAGL